MIPEWRQFQDLGQREWAARYDLRPADSDRRCLTWLLRGRHGNSRDCCEWSRWKDHPSAWVTPNGSRLLAVQPYGFQHHYLDMSRVLNRYQSVFPRYERPQNGWWAPSTTLVELWESEAAYRAARISK